MIVACLMYYSLSALWCLRGSVLICHWPRTPKVGNTSPFSIFVQGLSWVRLSWSCYSQQTQKCELAPQRTRQICIFVMMQSSHCHKDLGAAGRPAQIWADISEFRQDWALWQPGDMWLAQSVNLWAQELLGKSPSPVHMGTWMSTGRSGELGSDRKRGSKASEESTDSSENGPLGTRSRMW